MRRRNFLSAFGLGGAVAAVAAPSLVQAAPGKRDLKWARVQCEAGHRVRLEKWRVPLSERPAVEHGPSVATSRGGSPQGIESVEELIMTVEVMEGPWERVPEADMPKPPPPPASDGAIFLQAGNGGMGCDVTLIGGSGAGGGAGGSIKIFGGPID